MKIIEYNIVSLDDVNKAVDAVNRRISEGWQPFGAMAVSLDGDDSERFTQTLVRYDK